MMNRHIGNPSRKTDLSELKCCSLVEVISLLVAIMLIMSSFFVGDVKAYASTELPGSIMVYADGAEGKLVKGISISYKNNEYVSLRDMAAVLTGSSAAFDLSINDGKVYITKGSSYDITDGDNMDWTKEDLQSLSGHVLQNSILQVDNEEVRYFVMRVKRSDGIIDAYMMLIDLCMILDIDISSPKEGNINLNTKKPFTVNAEALEFDGYFQGVNAIACGDATTGEIYYEYNGQNAVPIASTTKLMTTAIALDAIAEGKISLNDKVRISSEVQQLSEGEDGVIHMTEGRSATVSDLLWAMLLPSSNESALAMAEYLGQDEKNFIKMMDKEAEKIGITTATFYNSNGLPSFNNNVVPAKRQNRMSAEDMFRLSSYIVNNYPEVTDITSTKKVRLSSFNDIEIKNTNALLYNMPQVIGLKTGTTTKAGACLVTAVKADVNGENHDLVVVMLGAETSQDRIRVSELLSRYALAVADGRVSADKRLISIEENEEPKKPKTAGEIVAYVVNSVR